MGINFSLNITKINSKNITLCFVHSIIVFQLLGSTRCYWHRQVESGQQCFYPFAAIPWILFWDCEFVFVQSWTRNTCEATAAFWLDWVWTEPPFWNGRTTFLSFSTQRSSEHAWCLFHLDVVVEMVLDYLYMQFFFSVVFFVFVLVRWKSIFNTDTFEQIVSFWE